MMRFIRVQEINAGLEVIDQMEIAHHDQIDHVGMALLQSTIN
jgi:hypothetical protein